MKYLQGFLLTTVGEEKKYNPRLTKTLDDFVVLMKNLKLQYPKQIGLFLFNLSFFYFESQNLI